MGELTREEVEQIVEEARQNGQKPNLTRMDLSESDFSKINLREADLSKADLIGTDLSEADLFNVNLSSAKLFEANISSAELSWANLSGAKLTRTKLNWSKLFKGNLTEAKINDAELKGVNFLEANLNGADLSGTDLSWTNLTRSNMTGTRLSDANLNGVDLSGANLSGADLRWTSLQDTNFSSTTLTGANFDQARVANIVLIDVDLSEVEGLNTAKHNRYSIIDFKTLEHSKGKIPDIFLRGCGLSDIHIEMAKLHNLDLAETKIKAITYKIHHLLIDNLIRYNSCFISYASQDEAFAQRLHADLQQKGVRCWFAPEDMKIGDKIRPVIDKSIRIHDKLLLILSGNSLNSVWVESEVEKAFEEEGKRKQTVLFPVRLDEAVMETGQSWAAEIRRTRHIGNFSRWKDHDAYQQAFERLLRDLKAEG